MVEELSILYYPLVGFITHISVICMFDMGLDRNTKSWKASDMALKYSLYNWMIDMKSSHIVIANGYTGAMAIISPEQYELFQAYFEKKDGLPLLIDGIGIDAVENLVYGGFLIDEEFDERRELEYQMKYSIFSEISSLTVVPTLECNFACKYCYLAGEVEKAEVISAEVISEIVKIADRCSNDSFCITFTGGEPLLVPDKIIETCQRVTEKRARTSRKTQATVITNGYLLTKEVLIDLKKNNVTKLQITLDGNAETHNQRRPAKNKEKTFKKIYRNILLASEYLKVNVRVNFEPSINGQMEVMKDLFIGYNNIHISQAITKYYIDRPEKTEYRNNVSYDSKSAAISVKQFLSKFHYRIGGCTATQQQGMVVLPDGSICKCWHEIAGKYKYRYGNIKSMPLGHHSDQKRLQKWIEFNPYAKNSECYNCKILPNCGGGCPADRVIENRKGCIRRFYRSQYEELLYKSAVVLFESE